MKAEKNLKLVFLIDKKLYDALMLNFAFLNVPYFIKNKKHKYNSLISKLGKINKYEINNYFYFSIKMC